MLCLCQDHLRFPQNLSSPPSWAPPFCPHRIQHGGSPQPPQHLGIGSWLPGKAGGFPPTHAPDLSPWAEKDWTEEDRGREKVLMQELVTLIEQRNAIVNCLDEDRQR